MIRALAHELARSLHASAQSDGALHEPKYLVETEGWECGLHLDAEVRKVFVTGDGGSYRLPVDERLEEVAMEDLDLSNCGLRFAMAGVPERLWLQNPNPWFAFPGLLEWWVHRVMLKAQATGAIVLEQYPGAGLAALVELFKRTTLQPEWQRAKLTHGYMTFGDHVNSYGEFDGAEFMGRPWVLVSYVTGALPQRALKQLVLWLHQRRDAGHVTFLHVLDDARDYFRKIKLSVAHTYENADERED